MPINHIESTEKINNKSQANKKNRRNKKVDPEFLINYFDSKPNSLNCIFTELSYYIPFSRSIPNTFSTAYGNQSSR
jgi:hypothetical protein